MGLFQFLRKRELIKSKELLERLQGKALGSFGIRMEQALKSYVEYPCLINKKDLRFMEDVIKKHY